MENGLITFLIIATVSLVVIGFIVAVIFFSLTLYRAMNKVPEEKRYFPSWFVWMMLVPIAGFVFTWMMMPWGVPRTLKNGVAGNVEAEGRADTLFGLGLAYSILVILPLTPNKGLFAVAFSGLFTVAFFVVWIIYWVKVAKFSKKYLQNRQ